MEWTWLSEDTSLLPHGWLPEIGFLPYRWDYYNEMMMMYLLGLGSPTYPLRPRPGMRGSGLTFEYEGMRYIGSFAPLFVHQYSQAWFDFRGKRDRYADYFQNSVIATEVHRRFCMELAGNFPDYSDDLWGITASDSRQWIRGMGRPASIGPDRRHGGPQRGGRVFAISSARNHAGAADHPEPISAGLELLWLRECLQSAEELV